MKILFDNADAVSGIKTYKTRANAVKAVTKLLENAKTNHRVLIAVTDEGRYMPVAIGQAAMQDGLHFHIAVVG